MAGTGRIPLWMVATVGGLGVIGVLSLFIFPCAALGVGLQIMRQNDIVDSDHFFSNVLNNNAGYTSFTFLCGFLIVFRTQQGYGRFCDGLTNLKAMQAEWYCAASNLVAFCRHSKAEAKEIRMFHHILLRLMSLLHAVALAELEGKEEDDDEEPVAFKLELIDVRGIDPESLDTLREVQCLVELIVQWVQSLTVMHINTGVLSIPPPILARVFHNLSNGLSSFHQAKKLADVPYPFPFMQATEWLLVLHWMVTPIVMANFTEEAVWAGVFSFLATFILWTLNTTATELENPFGEDDNDLHTEEMQTEMNRRYLTLLWPQASRIPTLSKWAILDEAALHHPQSMMSLQDVWDKLEKRGSADGPPRTTNRAYRNFQMASAETKDFVRRPVGTSIASSAGGGSVIAVNTMASDNPGRPHLSRIQHVDTLEPLQADAQSSDRGSTVESIVVAEEAPDSQTRRQVSHHSQETVLANDLGLEASDQPKFSPSMGNPDNPWSWEEEGRSSERQHSIQESRSPQISHIQQLQMPDRSQVGDPGAKFTSNQGREDDFDGYMAVARLNHRGDPRGVGIAAGSLRQNDRIEEGPGDVGPDPTPVCVD